MNASYPSRENAPALDDDLRACLASIVGYAVLLDSDDPHARRDAPRRIVESVQHLTERLERLQVERPTSTEQTSTEQSETRPQPARRVVAVDEDQASLELLKRMLPPGEFEVLAADDHETALRLAGMDDVEAVVLAWRASAFSGPETLAELKIRYPDLPVIVVAEANDDVYRPVAESLGADDFLTRPLTSFQVLSAADEALGPRLTQTATARASGS